MLTIRRFHLDTEVPRFGSAHNAHAYANIGTQTQPVVGRKVIQRVIPACPRMQMQPPDLACDWRKVFKRGVAQDVTSRKSPLKKE